MRAESLRDVIAAYDLNAVTGILRSVTCEELPHAELARLLYAPSDDAPDHPILINGHAYRYVGGDTEDVNFEPAPPLRLSRRRSSDLPELRSPPRRTRIANSRRTPSATMPSARSGR